ncbi:MAG: hypothetical protein H6523_15295 [Mycolicibacterium sp.]|nr:hypothetical protein [Mycolicibacterium sp.]
MTGPGIAMAVIERVPARRRRCPDPWPYRVTVTYPDGSRYASPRVAYADALRIAKERGAVIVTDPVRSQEAHQ